MTTYTLVDRVDYNIVTALRGPDGAGTHSILIKWLTTCVIRYFAGVPCLGSVNVVAPHEAKRMWRTHAHSSKLPIEMQRALIQAYFNTTIGWHFATHVGWAFQALEIKFPERAREIRAYYDWLKEEFPNTPLVG